VEATVRLHTSFVMRGFVLIGFGLVVGASAALIYIATRPEAVPSDPARGMSLVTPTGARPDAGVPETGGGRPQRSSVFALGTIEPAGGIVSVASPLVGYRVTTVHVREGEPVTAGQLLFELDATHPQAELDLVLSQLEEAEQRQQSEMRLAEQRLAVAEVGFEQARLGGKLELEAQEARVTAMVYRKDQAERDLQRIEQLRQVRESLVSEQQVEQQRVVVEAAAAELRAAELSLQALQQSLDFQRTSARLERDSAQIAYDLARQGIGLDTLKRRLELARIQLRQTEVRAPVDGVVLTLSARQGELVGQFPLLQLADLTSLICLAEIDTADIPLLNPRHPAEVRIRGREREPLSGQLERIGSAVVESRLRPLDPRRPVEHHVARGVVKLELADQQELERPGKAASLSAWVGLQVEVRFPLSEQATADSGALP
jgi:HlyD family secretion protein